MKKRDSDKNPFEKKNLVKLAPAAVVIAAVAAAGAQAGSSGKEVTAETREVVKSQDLESLLKTAYSYEAADDEAKEESLLKAGKNTSSASSKKKTSKISKKKITRTPVQFLLENLQWEDGDRILYQPLACPELESRWVLARRCSDRFEKMDFFLKKNCSDVKSVLDLGSYYGWFVNEFGKAGYDAFGVEKDNTAIMVGNIFFEKTRNKIFKNEIVRFLTTCEQYDAVCCLSIMHHFITGRIPGVAEHMLHLLDSATKSVLFFEMADSHEQWFTESLAGWTVDSIEAWVLKNSTFEHAIRLGADNDGVGAFKGNFGRTLIAFTR